ncbi:MAG: M14 family metallopeptidase [Gemmatimonadaceae bacterium]|jgi:murein tripeptide amidase MpaA|nr:M14 family metallopeptidase [Gemmatimonadaceae bacterium]
MPRAMHRVVQSVLLAAPLVATAQGDGAPRTRAERTRYAETTRHDEIRPFLDSVAALAPRAVHVTSMGRTTQGRELWMAIASRPLVRTPADARRLGRPVVYVQANIHSGEVEGKEAVLALLRDLATSSSPTPLDSIVWLVVPNYNADGNETVGPQARQRYEQNGPELVGQRPNGMGLDLNRDYVKAEAPETRAALTVIEAWRPHVFVDCHTTDGSFHGYALTYAPSLHPAAPLGAWSHDTLLPTLRERVATRHQFPLYAYGNFSAGYGDERLTDTVKTGWWTYDHRARYGVNLQGLTGTVAVLLEGYSHDPFERRVRSMYATLRELLSLAADPAQRILARTAAARQATRTLIGEIPIGATFTTTPRVDELVMEPLAKSGDSTARSEPGVPLGFRRTGRLVRQRMPVYDRFDATRRQRASVGGYAFDARWTDAVALLRRHGVTVDSLRSARTVVVDRFVVDTVRRAARPFQGHTELAVIGRWERRTEQLPAGSWVVRRGTDRDLVALQLLEPESDDGLLTWNVFDAGVAVGQPVPVMRLARPVPAR